MDVMETYDHFWPTGDSFFGLGCAGIIEKLPPHKADGSYLFINLDGVSLIRFMTHFSAMRALSKTMIIICSPRLMPLAKYWLVEYDYVAAIYESTRSVEDIISELIVILSGKVMVKPVLRRKTDVTHKDIYLLKSFLKEKSFAVIERLHGRQRSTIYRWRRSLTRKFGVRKIEHLLLL